MSKSSGLDRKQRGKGCLKSARIISTSLLLAWVANSPPQTGFCACACNHLTGRILAEGTFLSPVVHFPSLLLYQEKKAPPVTFLSAGMSEKAQEQKQK